ncbi:hypothetical protein ACFSM5_11360 [Lacibacterium aquatile]|uniref:Integron gene cassette protein n=1 Tax=Lacibacterium aquatile TaxID=1168082 RepID=A0ABW5DQP5_9PROT
MSGQDLFVGDELVRLQVEHYHVRLLFKEATLQLGAAFSITDDQGRVEILKPHEKTGEFGLLWQLLGVVAKEIAWAENHGDEVVMIFENGWKLTLAPAIDNHYRATVYAGDLDNNIIYDF